MTIPPFFGFPCISLICLSDSHRSRVLCPAAAASDPISSAGKAPAESGTSLTAHSFKSHTLSDFRILCPVHLRKKHFSRPGKGSKLPVQRLIDDQELSCLRMMGHVPDHIEISVRLFSSADNVSLLKCLTIVPGPIPVCSFCLFILIPLSCIILFSLWIKYHTGSCPFMQGLISFYCNLLSNHSFHLSSV